jgi:hypothetical protein
MYIGTMRQILLKFLVVGCLNAGTEPHVELLQHLHVHLHLMANAHSFSCPVAHNTK